MVINTSSLPSGGYGSPFESIVMEPMDYSEVIKHHNEYKGDILNKLLVDINVVLSPIQGIMSLNIYDMKLLIFTRKMITGTYNPVIKVEHGDLLYYVDTTQLEFNKLDESITNIAQIKLGDELYDFNIPTIGYFRNVLTDIVSNHPNTDIKFVYILAMLGYMENKNKIYDAVIHAKQQDILLLENIYRKLAYPIKGFGLMTSLEDQVGGGPVIVDLNETITDIFRFIELNNMVHPEQLTVK